MLAYGVYGSVLYSWYTSQVECDECFGTMYDSDELAEELYLSGEANSSLTDVCIYRLMCTIETYVYSNWTNSNKIS